MTWLQIEIERVLQGRSIIELAREWDVPRWVIDDIRHERIKMPGARYLAKIAIGLGMTTDELLAAYASPPPGVPV